MTVKTNAATEVLTPSKAQDAEINDSEVSDSELDTVVGGINPQPLPPRRLPT